MIDYLFLGLISLATLIWAFFTLPNDDDSQDDSHSGGTSAGGDASPTDQPPTLVSDSPEKKTTQENAGHPDPRPSQDN
jgi:hypothetical protein